MKPFDEEHPKFIDFLVKTAKDASAEAFTKARNTGLPILILEGKNLSYLYSDGKKRFCKKIN